MRYLGIDYGTKRVGISLSDVEGFMAFPNSVMQNTKTLTQDILDLCDKEEVEEVVIGESKNLDGTPNPLMEHIDDFIKKWKENTSIPIATEPEFLTSHQAQKIQGMNSMIDASAATIILQSYIDKKKNN